MPKKAISGGSKHLTYFFTRNVPESKILKFRSWRPSRGSRFCGMGSPPFLSGFMHILFSGGSLVNKSSDQNSWESLSNGQPAYDSVTYWQQYQNFQQQLQQQHQQLQQQHQQLQQQYQQFQHIYQQWQVVTNFTNYTFYIIIYTMTSLISKFQIC